MFSDPSQRRIRKVRKVFRSVLIVLAVWTALVSVNLLATDNLAVDASLDLRGIPARPDGQRLPAAAALSFAAAPAIAQDTGASADPCPATPATTDAFAFVPRAQHLPEHSLRASCGAVRHLLAEWYVLAVAADGAVEIARPDKETRQDLLGLKAEFDLKTLYPVIVLDQPSRMTEGADKAPGFSAARLQPVLQTIVSETEADGTCIDLSTLPPDRMAAFGGVIRDWSDRSLIRGLSSCLIFPASVDNGVLARFSADVDQVVLKLFEPPWTGSLPAPLAGEDWVAERVATARLLVEPHKLVLALGTGSVDWVSNRAQPDAIGYAEAITRLAGHEAFAAFDATSGTTFGSFVDEAGARHRVWMLDAASFHNQRRIAAAAGLERLAIWPIGAEDPGLWRLLAAPPDRAPDLAGALATVAVAHHVSSSGAGPFLVPIAQARPGHRDLTFDPATGRVTDLTYTVFPSAHRVMHYGAPLPNQVVLTFDDGPLEPFTSEILDILRREDVPAAFFLLGQNVANAPDVVRRILREGHEIGSHTYWHSHMDAVSPTRFRLEVNSVQMLVNGLTGRSMRLYRDPYLPGGDLLPPGHVAHMTRLSDAGYILAGMGIVPRDWEAESAAAITDEVIAQVRAGKGNVILLHDGGGDQSRTVEALPGIIAGLRAAGYDFVGLSDLLDMTDAALMPPVSASQKALGNISFFTVVWSWTALQWAFWSALAIGVIRALLMLVLALRRRPHRVPDADFTPSVAILIPAYNEAPVIRKGIQTALASDYPDFDVIVVDDGSSDQTSAQVRPFLADPRVTLVRQPNSGKAAALNHALDLTDAEIVICIDADSQLHPGAVRAMVRHFSDAAVGAVAGKVVVGNRHNLLTRLQCLEYIAMQSIDRRAKESFNAIPVVPGAIGAWRATAILEAGIYAEDTITEDADLTMSLVRNGYCVVYEEAAVATTEVPEKLRDLVGQRLRWSLGMLQSCWKHRGALREGRGLGLLTLPDMAIFGYLLPVLAPFADLFLLYALVDVLTASAGQELALSPASYGWALAAYALLPIIDLVTLMAGFALDPKEDRRLLLVFPLQRIFYRQVLYVCVLRALWLAVSGRLALWAKIRRVGFDFDAEKVS